MSDLPEVVPNRMSTDSLEEVLQLLERTQALLSSPDKWCKHVMALDAMGHAVMPDDPGAQRFCISGAVLRAESDMYGTSFDWTCGDSEADPLDRSELWTKVPQRVMAALGLLAHPLYLVWTYVFDDALEDDPTADLASRFVFDDPMQAWREIAHAVAAAVNDENGIQWGHISAGLKFAVRVTEDELARRSPTAAGLSFTSTSSRG